MLLLFFCFFVVVAAATVVVVAVVAAVVVVQRFFKLHEARQHEQQYNLTCLTLVSSTFSYFVSIFTNFCCTCTTSRCEVSKFCCSF